MVFSPQASFLKVGPVTSQFPPSFCKPCGAFAARLKPQSLAGKPLSSACTIGTLLQHKALVVHQSVVCCQTYNEGHYFRGRDGNWKFDIEEALLMAVISGIFIFWQLIGPAPDGHIAPMTSSYTLEARAVSSSLIVSSQPLAQNQGQQQQQYWESLAEVARKQDSFQADLLQRQQAYEQQMHASIKALQQEMQLIKGRIAE